jgi:hypothetical protein
LSHTSHGVHFGRLHRDLMSRNFVLSALEHSQRVSKNTIERFHSARTFAENFDVLPNVSFAASCLVEIWTIWDELLHLVGRLQWNRALALLAPLRDNTTRLSLLTDSALKRMDSFRCVATLERMRKEHRSPATSWRLMLVGALVLNIAALTAFVIMYKQKGNKVKIN